MIDTMTSPFRALHRGRVWEVEESVYALHTLYGEECADITVCSRPTTCNRFTTITTAMADKYHLPSLAGQSTTSEEPSV